MPTERWATNEVGIVREVLVPFQLREEELRAQKYLESCSGSVQNLVASCVAVLITANKDAILAETPKMISKNETTKLQLMFRLMDRVPEAAGGIAPMLEYLEAHIYEVIEGHYRIRVELEPFSLLERHCRHD